ncbi:hypothetical protein [Oceaniglobus trochenteri]|uniref:hypothetical protein n=1 Tax=Oceaniglobus trochenteri TaxID=2763260 RepID=UPI001CFFFF11|nr:hypothetical protein [Oceaniglobus trochenteri]
MKQLCAVLLALLPLWAVAQEGPLRVSAPEALIDSGLLQHILPRFALKHGMRAVAVTGPGDATFGEEGAAVFHGLGQTWHFAPGPGPGGAALLDWLRSDIGRRTVEGFAPDGTAPFSAEIAPEEAAAPTLPQGDPVAGERLALVHCGRCHVVNASNRMKGMGATPSFAMLRTLPDWENRFAGFYALNPHPSFTQVQGVTPPFDISRPSPIIPLTVTLDDIAAITAYAAGIAPADLGAPIRSR